MTRVLSEILVFIAAFIATGACIVAGLRIMDVLP